MVSCSCVHVDSGDCVDVPVDDCYVLPCPSGYYHHAVSCSDVYLTWGACLLPGNPGNPYCNCSHASEMFCDNSGGEWLGTDTISYCTSQDCQNPSDNPSFNECNAIAKFARDALLGRCRRLHRPAGDPTDPRCECEYNAHLLKCQLTYECLIIWEQRQGISTNHPGEWYDECKSKIKTCPGDPTSSKSIQPLEIPADVAKLYKDTFGDERTLEQEEDCACWVISKHNKLGFPIGDSEEVDGVGSAESCYELGGEWRCGIQNNNNYMRCREMDNQAFDECMEAVPDSWLILESYEKRARKCFCERKMRRFECELLNRYCDDACLCRHWQGLYEYINNSSKGCSPHDGPEPTLYQKLLDLRPGGCEYPDEISDNDGKGEISDARSVLSTPRKTGGKNKLTRKMSPPTKKRDRIEKDQAFWEGFGKKN